MSTDLTPGQYALLEAALLQRQQLLEHELHVQLDGQGRVEHARQQLLEDNDGETAHDADREVDLARSDLTTDALRHVNEALLRLRKRQDYGICVDCGCAIPFDRLHLSPEVLRCTDCQSTLETRGGGTSHHTL